ncbi:HTH cro/C1-type domain-containing protein [Flavobacterium longum]|uniref:XRE family transcriptional regulator n=1 Tax=Flavobacterium longum TaxID=1299340 RepID=UPI0039EADFF5
MQKQIEQNEVELSKRIYELFLVKFKGNKSAFARASKCSEGAVRKVFQNKQSITFNLLLRFSHALDVQLSELVKGLDLKSEA